MAWTYNLLNDDTTLQLNDGSDYRVMEFSSPPPNRRMAISTSLLKDGGDLIERRFDNRIVTLSLHILSTSQDDLIANINAINDLLERGAEYTISGLNSQLILRRQWDNATNTTDFDVLEGVLTLPEGTVPHLLHTQMVRAELRLLCRPFATGADETIENYVADPSFEVAGTALADWTEASSGPPTGSTSRVTTDAKYGSASLEISITAGSSGEYYERNQIIADADGDETWSFSAWVYAPTLTQSKVEIVVVETGGSASTYKSTAITSTNAAYTQVSIANQTLTTGVTAVTLSCRVEATGSSPSATVRFDGVMAVQATSVPTAWASGHSVANHGDDDGQAHINYLDIEDIPGDLPALLQVKATEGEEVRDSLGWTNSRTWFRKKKTEGHDSHCVGTSLDLEAQGEISEHFYQAVT